MIVFIHYNQPLPLICPLYLVSGCWGSLSCNQGQAKHLNQLCVQKNKIKKGCKHSDHSAKVWSTERLTLKGLFWKKARCDYLLLYYKLTFSPPELPQLISCVSYRKNCVFFTIHCNPSLVYVAVRDLQSSQRNASVQSLLLAGNILYNQ